VVGAALIEIIRNSLTLLGINPFWQGTFVGTFIIVAVLFDRIRSNPALLNMSFTRAKPAPALGPVERAPAE
jgi:ribose/xylose/arabinose/galactoside ABC-type transport system permease subunit